jgi:hypothetical protein
MVVGGWSNVERALVVARADRTNPSIPSTLWCEGSFISAQQLERPRVFTYAIVPVD